MKNENEVLFTGSDTGASITSGYQVNDWAKLRVHCSSLGSMSNRLLIVIFITQLCLSSCSHQDNVQRLIDDAIAKKQSLLSIPKGTYYFDSDNAVLHDSIGLLNIVNASDLTIDGNGSTFIFRKIDLGFSIFNCKNLILKNLSIDYDPLPFTQGIITSIENKSITLKIDKGYRDDVEYFNKPGYHKVLMNRSQFSEICRLFPQTIKAVNKGEFVMEMSDVSCLKVNDPIVLLCRYENAILSKFSSKTTYENINIYSSPGFALFELYGEGGSTLRNVRIVEGPIPEGASKQRLLSSSGDALHFASQEKGPLIEQCEVRNSDDDFINIEGFMYRALSKKSPTEFSFFGKTFMTDFFIGDTLDIFDGESFVLKGRTVITEKRMDAGSNECILKINSQNLIATNDFVSAIARFCKGAIVRGNKFYNTFGSINLQTEDVVFENNEINGTSYGCMNIGAAYLSYPAEPTNIVAANMSREGVFANNILVRSNSFKNIRTSADGTTNNYGPAAVWIGQGGSPQSNFNKERNNRNIRFENNIIDSCAYGAFFISNASHVSVIGNTITNTNLSSGTDMVSYWDAPDKTCVIIKSCDNISFLNNSFPDKNKQGVNFLFVDKLSEMSTIKGIVQSSVDIDR